MHRSRLSAAFSLLLFSAGLLLAAPLNDPPDESRLLRFPDIHRDFVVFVHAGDLWYVPTAGGVARRLTAHEGLELFPKISPDGEWIAFTAEYTGSRQVFVMHADGGPSLERAVEFLLDQLARQPQAPPATPEPPDIGR